MSRRSESVGYAIAAGRYARHLQGQREAPRKRILLRGKTSPLKVSNEPALQGPFHWPRGVTLVYVSHRLAADTPSRMAGHASAVRFGLSSAACHLDRLDRGSIAACCRARRGPVQPQPDQRAASRPASAAAATARRRPGAACPTATTRIAVEVPWLPQPSPLWCRRNGRATSAFSSPANQPPAGAGPQASASRSTPRSIAASDRFA